jgi:exopolyphosphatase/guanosine-5'-triphosphate,3'-diphosphate pyrophosphatase
VQPTEKHKYYRTLKAEQKTIVHYLSSLLRLADGLDATHEHLVSGLTCVFDEDGLTVNLVSRSAIDDEIKSCLEKADFFKEFFKKDIFLNVAISPRA